MLCHRSQDVKKYHGVMLLEMLMAVFISLLMISVLTRVYLTMQKTNMRQYQLEAQQDRAQKVMNILRNDILMAGYIGCGKLSNEFNVIAYQQFSLTMDNFLVVEKDKITLRYQYFPGAVVTNDMRSTTKIVTDKAEYFHAGQLALISDCLHAEIFRVGGVWVSGVMQVITTESPLHYLYHQFAEVGGLTIHQYYLGKSKHQQKKRPRIDSLFRLDTKNRHHEMVEGIANLAFSHIKNDVFFEFKTTSDEGGKRWYGYAANRCCVQV